MSIQWAGSPASMMVDGAVDGEKQTGRHLAISCFAGILAFYQNFKEQELNVSSEGPPTFTPSVDIFEDLE